MRRKNIECFFEWQKHRLGQDLEKNCQGCGSICDVERERRGKISMYGKSDTLHDYWFCPHIERGWHRQLVNLRDELEDTHSPSLKKMIMTDMNKIRESNGLPRIDTEIYSVMFPNPMSEMNENLNRLFKRFGLE